MAESILKREVKQFLLWTNPSPQNAFNAQTLSLDLSEFDAVEVIFRTGTSTSDRYTLPAVRVDIGNTGVIFNTTAYNSERRFTVNTTGIVFTNALYYASYGNWSGSSTNALIPYKIYGLKSEGGGLSLVDKLHTFFLSFIRRCM